MIFICCHTPHVSTLFFHVFWVPVYQPYEYLTGEETCRKQIWFPKIFLNN